jgi:monoamine oxidase
MDNNHKTIIVVGAGIAGLVAARELSSRYNVIVLEAANRIGGRIYTLEDDSFSTVIEAGAEFIHGEARHTLALLKEAGIRHLLVEGKMYRKEKGQWVVQEEMIEGWDALLKKMRKVKVDTTMYDFLQENYGDDKYSDLRRHAIAFAEGFDIADVKKASVKSLYREWSKTDEHYRIPSGYGALVRFLADDCINKGCRIITDEPIKQVDWEPGDVTVYTKQDKKYYADKIIITVPVSILQQALGKAAINFTPPLDEYIKATHQVGFGHVIKIVAQFDSAFWEEDMGFVFSDEQFPTWWTQLPDKVPVLTGWAGGTKATLMEGNTDEELLEKALLSLANIFDLPVQTIKQKMLASRVFDWQKNVWSCGAYSYGMPETVAARELLHTPIDSTIFFTGEAIDDGDSPGTVEGAIAHAYSMTKMLEEADNTTVTPS